MRKSILIVIGTLKLGGAERQVINDANNLFKNGFDITVCYGKYGNLCSQLVEGVNIINLNTNSKILGVLRILKLLLKNRYDIVFSHMFWANIVSGISAQLTNHRIVFFEHGLALWRNKIQQATFRLVSKKASLIITCSEASKKTRIDQGIPSNKIKVIPNSYRNNNNDKDEETVKINDIEDDKIFRILFVGRFNEVKQLSVLIKVAQELLVMDIKDFSFILVGDGDTKPEIEKTIIEKNLQDHFVLTGYKNNPQIFYEISNCFVLPSRREDFSLSLLEASSSGLPCIAFNVGGNAEIIQDGKTGFVIKPYSTDQFVEKLGYLIKNPIIANDMGLNAKKRVETCFSEDSRYNNFKETILGFLNIIEQ